MRSRSLYTINVNAVDLTKNAMDDISLNYHTNGEWKYSMNPGSARGLVSFFGNVLPERIVYNVGWIQYGSVWLHRNPVNADREFSRIAAHEIGHEILSAYGGESYSYGHKGTSTVISQRELKLSEGGVAYPQHGPIDLMKYYNGSRPVGLNARSTASDEDLRSLIWLSRIIFSE